MESQVINSKNIIITALQCRAARSMLNWTQDILAEKIRVSKSTIANFELEVSKPYKKNLEDIRKVFEEHGIEFENTDIKISVALTVFNNS